MQGDRFKIMGSIA